MSHCSHTYNCNCSHCSSDCGCTHQHSTECILYKGDTLNCISVNSGDDLELILSNINEAICDLAPSGNTNTTTVVKSCSESIHVSSAPSGNNTVYTVCLDDSITIQLSENTSDIATIFDCLEDTVKDLVSNTIYVTEESSNDCGRTLRLEVATPSGNPNYDGIIYNDTTAVGTSGSVGDKVLKQFTHNYSNQSLTTGDDIRFLATGQILGDGSLVDSVKIELFNATTAILVYGESFSGFDLVNKQSWLLRGDLAVTSSTTGVLSLEFLTSGKQNGTKSNITGNSQIVVSADVTGIDFTNLTIRIIYVHDSSSGATYNFAKQLQVEVRKLI